MTVVVRKEFGGISVVINNELESEVLEVKVELNAAPVPTALTESHVPCTLSRTFCSRCWNSRVSQH